MLRTNPRWVARNVVRRVPAMNAHLPLHAWARLWGGPDGPGIDAVSIVRRIADQAGHPLSFVQVGANDGEMGDPLHDVVIGHGWRGVVIEPLPHLFAALASSYREAPAVICEQTAIGDHEGTATIYTVRPKPADPVWVIGLSSFRRDVILESQAELPDIATRIEEVEVPVTRLATLLDKHQVNHIDLLQIDTEGYDFEILKQIDFSRPWAPWHIIYEACHLGDDLDRAREMLRGAGYTIFPCGYDDYAYRG